jgi:hypothetical protein
MIFSTAESESELWPEEVRSLSVVLYECVLFWPNAVSSHRCQRGGFDQQQISEQSWLRSRAHLGTLALPLLDDVTHLRGPLGAHLPPTSTIGSTLLSEGHIDSRTSYHSENLCPAY